MAGCRFVYQLDLSGDTLRLSAVKPCSDPDAVYNTTLFASFSLRMTAIDDPLAGTWQTDHLTEGQIVQAFVAAAGSEKEGHEFFSQLGGGSINYTILTLQFQDGALTEFESGDGRNPIQGFKDTYEIGDDDTLTTVGCHFTYRLDASRDTLQIYLAKPCSDGEARFGITLVASFPMTRTG
jgi:hypothetical protein